MSQEERIRMLGDELRVLADDGLAWRADDPYHHDRYTRVRRAAAEVFSIADERDAGETVSSQLTHIA